jgi:TolB-like protein/Tfp pilus assembly protein PilF
MIGKTVSHYEILERLGEGGMGVVYKARDLDLERFAALKFLPAHSLDRDDALERFRKEARAASSLDHPNVATIYEIDRTEDGTAFIAMACYEGETLDQRLERGRTNHLEAAEITAQAAAGLARAHANGIVHRDVKPANLLVTNEGVVKVLDFGLARVASETRLTKTGTTVGTVHYMSPEQALGKEADERSDVFSLGVVLYQLLSGRLPFRGEQQVAVLYAIANEKHEPVVKAAPGVSRDLAAIVERALEKDPDARWPTMDALRAELEGWIAQEKARRSEARTAGAPAANGPRSRTRFVIGAFAALVLLAGAVFVGSRLFAPSAPESPASNRKVLAVLPFENLGPPEDEYFAAGITEEITARLAGLRGVGVIARTSVNQYKGTTKTVSQIGEELGIDFLLEGSVRWEHNPDGPSRVRVTPQLIRVADETHVWAEVYDESLEEVFRVQTDVATRVARELDLALNETEVNFLEERPTDDVEAYNYFLLGVEHMRNQKAEEDVRSALRMFEKAVELDSTFALAYAGICGTQTALYWFYDRSQDHVARAKEAVDRALRLDPDQFGVRMALGDYYYHGLLDYDRALPEFERARELAPGLSDPVASIGFVERRQGKWEDALRHLKEAIELDPRFFLLASEIGETLIDLGRYEESLGYFDRSIAMAPDNLSAYLWKAFATTLKDGNARRSQEILQEAPFDPTGLVAFEISRYQYMQGDFEGAYRTLEGCSLEAVDDHFYYLPKSLQLGRLCTFMGKTEEARQHYEDARAQVEGLLEQNPRDSRLHGAMGMVLARLGKKDEAIREGRRGVELMPVSKEAKQGPQRLAELAEIYTVVGEEEKALDLLESLVVMPASWIRPPVLRLDPVWDPLRGNPRFQELLERDEVVL